jgi:hypothetical protein
MTTLFLSRIGQLLAAAGLFLAAVVLSGCPNYEATPTHKTTPRVEKEIPAEEPAPPPAAAEPAKDTKSDELRGMDETPPKPETPVKPETSAKPDTPAKPETSAKPESETPETELTETLEKIEKKPRDLGPPLVENADGLKRLDPEQPVWIDPKNKQVVLIGEVCKAGYPLEFFATYSNRAYEAVVAVNVKPSIIHAGLVAVGAEAGHPAKFQDEFVPPAGTEVAIDVHWKDAEGKTQSARAQEWIRNIQTKKPMEGNWVFAGSSFWTDEEGKRHYSADAGDMICVLNLPTALLDVPMRSYSALESRTFEAFAERLPPAGTPVTLVLKPILKPKEDKPAEEPGKDVNPAETNKDEAKTLPEDQK